MLISDSMPEIRRPQEPKEIYAQSLVLAPFHAYFPLEDFLSVMTRSTGWVWRFRRSRGASGVGSRQKVFEISRVGSGRVGSCRVGSGRVGSCRVGSGQEDFKNDRSGRVTLARSDPRAVIRPVESPVNIQRRGNRSEIPTLTACEARDVVALQCPLATFLRIYPAER